MDLADFDYDLPPPAVAQRPVEPRDAARLLVDGGPGAPVAHRRVADVPDLVGPGDVVEVEVPGISRVRNQVVASGD